MSSGLRWASRESSTNVFERRAEPWPRFATLMRTLIEFPTAATAGGLDTDLTRRSGRAACAAGTIATASAAAALATKTDLGVFITVMAQFLSIGGNCLGMGRVGS
jgi:hypothetical protein